MTKLYILKPKENTKLYQFIKNLNLSENHENCCFIISYYFYKKYILDKDENKFINREYEVSSSHFDGLIGSSNWRDLKKSIVWDDKKYRKDNGLNPEDKIHNRQTRILYTTVSYVSESKDKKPRSMAYSLDKSYILEEWELVKIDQTYTTRAKSKNKDFKSKLAYKRWNLKLKDSYNNVLDRIKVNKTKALEMYSRMNKKVSDEYIQTLTCELMNFDNCSNRISRSDAVHRLYSKVSLMESTSRYTLEFDNKPTVIFDIKNCSAYMVYPLIKDKNEQKLWETWLNKGLYEELTKYISANRKEVKLAFSVWQGGVIDKGLAKQINEVIQSQFPIFHSYFLKKHTVSSKWLSYYCQQTDASIVVDQIVLNKNVGFESVSIHDAILVKEEDKDLALKALKEAVENTIGIKPRIELEDPLEDFPVVDSVKPNEVEDDELFLALWDLSIEKT